ncbi:MAG: hypothetical protein A3K90_04970 [Pelodictyon luteolum]|uniref:Lipoprotein n=1 Tax=Pelodictyon luteolum TaxID=1100 RepID=A0A165LPG7_PELLU|nr:MAG: hypothetical protein A3K90_04970 [Pelodictyon luteolum]
MMTPKFKGVSTVVIEISFLISAVALAVTACASLKPNADIESSAATAKSFFCFIFQSPYEGLMNEMFNESTLSESFTHKFTGMKSRIKETNTHFF